MRVPLSWLKDYVDITISAEELAERLTLAGLEVKAIEYIGVPQGVAPEGITVPPSGHLVWARDKIVLGAIHEVKAHPNADKLVLAMVDYGAGTPEQVVTGAPNLYPYKDKGPISPPLYTPLALEGAEVFDGHAEGQQRMILKEKPLRGIPNRSMVCSAKELGLGEDHDGILLLDPADVGAKHPPGTPFVDVLGDVILEIDILPNTARAFGIFGVAREVAALTGQTAREPSYDYLADKSLGAAGEAFAIEIKDARLNPRFCGMLIRDVQLMPSPGWLRRRLAAVGVRAISNMVDITNYIMFETGQPLHAFDYDVLVGRAGGGKPTIITRTAAPGEKLTTLDGVERVLDEQVILVCDTAGSLSVGGVMGGLESEISDGTRNVLLEAANWDFINIRRTMGALRLNSEAGLRFSRGVHPAMAERGVRRAAEMMRALGGPSAKIAPGVVDNYPLPAPVIRIDLSMGYARDFIGAPILTQDAADMLRRLQFEVVVEDRPGVDDDVLHVTVPDHRVDIAAGEVGVADLCEEIARIYGYDRIPNSLIEDLLPPQTGNTSLTREERVRDLLAQAELREVINYRLTTPEAEARLVPAGGQSGWPNVPYVMLLNPMTVDRTALRHTLLNGLLVNIADNLRHTDRLRVFEIGSVFLPRPGVPLPDEPRRLTLALTGPRPTPGWPDGPEARKNRARPENFMDFFDLKGVIEALCEGLRLPGSALAFKPAEHTTFYPGRCAGVYLRGTLIGHIGEIHPLVRENYAIRQPVIAAELDLDDLIADIPTIDSITPVPTQPAIYEDIALIVPEATPAAQVEATIREAGGALLRAVELFDVYRGEPIPPGKKSLAYALTFLAPERTLTDNEVAKVRAQIVKAAEKAFGAALRA
jgi:phenylalanyl-tRNA synthetase beta chain